MMSSLYIGATGLKTHGEGMSVVTNNLSNVNTIGYKQASVNYQDLVSQFMASADSNGITNISQVGAGSMVGSIRTLFTDGGYETGSASTDLSISGKGFFGVMQDGALQYTRAGNFRFTKEGDLVDPSGWQLMGYAIGADGKTATTASPIHLDFSEKGVGYMAGKGTTSLTAYSQLGGVEDKSEDASNPFFAMVSNYDGTETPPLSLSQYSYCEPITINDSEGNQRKAYIYYDLAGKSNGQKAYEYVVALDPSEDTSGNAGTKSAGLLMAGTMSFTSTGYLQNVTAFTPSGSDPANLSSWTPASLDSAGHPQFNVKYSDSDAQTIALNVGLSLSGSASGGFASAAALAADSAAVYGPATGAVRDKTSSISAGTSAGSIFQQNNGYTEGYLYNVHITADGTMYGSYSNNQSQDLCKIPLYRFTSEDGLRREGGNRFSATLESGAVEEGLPGVENFGKLNESSLEQSNVDYTREFSNMIITQRGFQMNSKVVTTSDAMLQKALEMKR